MTKTKAGPVSGGRLKSFVERIERLREELKALQGDIRDVFSEAKGVGYDVKTMRKVIALRGMDAADRDEQEALLDVYWHALTVIDRVEARVAAGEPITRATKEEGYSRATYYRVSQKRTDAPNETVAEGCGEEGGIRTHEGREPLADGAAAINRSATSGTLQRRDDSTDEAPEPPPVGAVGSPVGDRVATNNDSTTGKAHEGENGFGRRAAPIDRDQQAAPASAAASQDPARDPVAGNTGGSDEEHLSAQPESRPLTGHPEAALVAPPGSGVDDLEPPAFLDRRQNRAAA